MASPRVLHLAISLDPGGLERLVVDWTHTRNQTLSDSTHICTLDKPGQLATQLEERWITSLHAQRHKFPFDRGALAQLRRLLRIGFGGSAYRQPVEILHTHNMAALQYGVLATLGTPCKQVHTQHGSNVGLNFFQNRVRNALLMRCVNGLVAVSQATARDLAEIAFVGRQRIQVVPNGVQMIPDWDDEEFLEIRQGLHMAPGDWLMGSVGRLAPVKGYDRLIRCFARMQTENRPRPQCLLLVGDGPQRADLEVLVDHLGITGRVIFAGYQPNVQPYVRAMDLFVVPSRSEGLSVALLEAMALQRPVAVTDVGENRQVIDEGRAGWLLPPSTSDWGALLAEIYGTRDAVHSRQKILYAALRVREVYNMARTLGQYERLYTQLLQNVR